MGYPMTYARVVQRNGLRGNYQNGFWSKETRLPDGDICKNALIAGDMRRLEQDQRDERHLARYAKEAGITPEQAKAVLDLFFRSASVNYTGDVVS